MRKKLNRLNKGDIGSYGVIQGEGIRTTTSSYTDNSRNVDIINDVLNDLGNTYSPPSAWRSLPTINVGDQKFAGVYAIYDTNGNYVALRARGAYIVDWGDGTTGAFADNTIASKIYDQTTYAGLTSDVYNGYKTLVIQVTPQAGATFTSMETAVRHPSLTSAHYTNWLNILMSAPELTTLQISNSGSTDQCATMLEQFIFLGTNKITTGAQRCFANCFQLQKVSLDTTTFTNPFQLFLNCSSLKSVPLFNTRNCTTFNSVFNGCFSLTSVPLFDTSNCTDFAGAFSFCYSLKSVPPFNTSNVTNFDSAFRECYSLVEFPEINFSKATTTNLLFNACYNLKKVPRFNMPNCTTITGMFQGCRNLISIPELRPSASITSMNVVFSACNALEEIPFFDTSNVTVFSSAFSNCFKIKKLPQFNTSNVTNFASMCASCVSLTEFPKFDFSKATTINQSFNTCTALQGGTNFGLTLTNVTNIGAAFQSCVSLQYLPVLNLINATSLNATFNNCQNLREVNIAGICGVETNLTVNSFTNTFQNCFALQSVTGFIDVRGYTGAAFVNVYSNMFANSSCSSLEYIGFTGIQQSFSIANCKFGATALNNIYSSLAVVGASGAGSKTITVTGNWGVVNDTPAIATSKGWTVTG